MSTPNFAEIRSSAISSMPNIAIAKGRYVVGALALGGSLFVLGQADPASAHVVKGSTKQQAASTGTKASSAKAPASRSAKTTKSPQGMRLSAPASGKTYTVAAGDNLTSIASKTGVSASTIAQLNRVTNEDQIRPGQLLMIPSGKVTTSAASTNGTSTRGTSTKASTTKSASAKPATSAAATSTKVVKVSSSAKPATSAAATSTKAAKKGTSNTGKPSPGQGLPDAIRGTQRAKLEPTFNRVAAQFGVPAELLKAVAYHESGWNNTKVSSAGAQGIGQIMPATADFVNKSLVKQKLNPAVPEDNIKMSAAFLRYLLNQTGGDETKAVGAYYQGLGALQRHGLYQDTLVYISNIQALRAHWF